MIQPQEFALMLHWIRAREAIRKAKEAGKPKPWTDEPVLRDYRWCNVRRMDDRVSVELSQSWYASGGDCQTQLVACALGRLINWPDALLAATNEELFRMAHLPGFGNRLTARVKEGHKTFTGAYIVPGVPGKTKIHSVMAVVNHVSANYLFIYMDTLRGTWTKLTEIDGLGSFLAGQIVADMAHLTYGKAWPDRKEWAPLGPGSKRGMNRLHGRAKETPMSQAQFDTELYELRLWLWENIRDIWIDRDLFACDIQGLCCEFDKYKRLLLSEGSVRAKYSGKANA